MGWDCDSRHAGLHAGRFHPAWAKRPPRRDLNLGRIGGCASVCHFGTHGSDLRFY